LILVINDIAIRNGQGYGERSTGQGRSNEAGHRVGQGYGTMRPG